jgi:diguanylate cyclase (GGDEF)-like protein/PAS domain S-box-containing protein
VVTSTAAEVLRILLVEDDEDDYLITRDLLSSQDRARFELEWSGSYHAGLEAIVQERHDVYLIDYRLGARTGLDLVREGFATRARAPVILLTGRNEYDVDLEATALGVTDYLVKTELDPTVLERSIRYAHSHHVVVSELIRSEERYALAVRATNDGIWDWDITTRRLYLSPRYHETLGRTEEIDGGHENVWFEVVHPEDFPRLRAAVDAHLAGHTEHLEVETRMSHADGTWRWILTRGLAIRDPAGNATRMAGSISDVTERRRVEEQLQHDALHDALTGLPNRALFIDRVGQALERAVRDPSDAAAVLFLDVDRFKLVNDSLSHAVGDSLLIALSQRIAAVLRPGDTVARIGGDEFTILLDGVGTEAAARMVADRVQEALRRPFAIDRHELFVTASVGMALSAPRMTPAELIRNADIAMYDAKRQGRARCAAFDESMRRRVVDRLARENELRRAIEGSLLPVHFQPIVDLRSGRVTAFEALVRWPRGWSEVEPLEFIPIAEDTGVIAALGIHVLRTALRQLADWRSRGIVADDVGVSVNLSARQLDDSALADEVADALEAAGIEGGALALEITESTLMLDPGRMRPVVDKLGATGAVLHLDDFGTGYSSLSLLHTFPLQSLKIDRSFVAAMGAGSGHEGEAIVRSTVALAHSLGMSVIAEGIEQPPQLKRLRALGCEHGQGFLFSEALPVAGVETLLQSWTCNGGRRLGVARQSR